MIVMGNYNRGKEIVQAEGVYIGSTEKAQLIKFEEAGDVWLPISQFHKETEIDDTETKDCTVFIPKWLAEQNRINYDDYDPEENEEAGGIDPFLQTR